MRKKLLALLVVFAFISVSSFSVIFFARGNVKDDPTYAKDRWDLEGISGTPNLKGVVYDNMIPDTGNTWTVNVSDDYYGGTFEMDFECVLPGEKANIWIGLDPTVWTDGWHDEYVDDGDGEYGPGDVWNFAYPWTYFGLPWDYSDLSQGYYLYPGYRDWITYENLEYVLGEFDRDVTGIHDKVIEHFGEYADRPGPLDDYKIQILIFNIRDGLFWDPVTAPWFIMGYYSYYVSNLNDANIFHMDSYQWWRRLGEREDPLEYGLWPLPLQYEGTFAHEFQHLIHHDVDPDEHSWVNEGCSTLAEWVCGYGFQSNIFYYIAYWWVTSLVIWDNYLENYGAVFLWTYYCYEHYGGKALIQALASDPDNGIEGWSNALSLFTWKTFDQIFEDWAMANYLDDPSFAHGRYGYYDFDIPSADTGWWDIPYSIGYWEYWYPEDFDTL